jgi:hypothetical protein
VDDPAVRTEAAAEVPPADLDMFDSRGDLFRFPDVGRSGGEGGRDRAEKETGDEPAAAGTGAKDRSLPHPVK